MTTFDVYGRRRGESLEHAKPIIRCVYCGRSMHIRDDVASLDLLVFDARARHLSRSCRAIGITSQYEIEESRNGWATVLRYHPRLHL